MKMKTAALALLLLAGTAPMALAQEQDQGGRPHERGGAERPAHPRGEAHDRAVQGGQPGWRHAQPQGQPQQPQPRPAPVAPQARPAPAAPAPQGPRAEHFQDGRRIQGGGRWQGGPPGQPPARPGVDGPAAPAPQGSRPEHFQGGGRVQGGGRWQGGPPGQPGVDGRALQGRPGRWVDRDGETPGAVQSPGDRADHEDRQDLGDYRRFNGGRDGHWEGDRRSADGPQAHGRDGRRDGDWNRGDGNRNDWRGRPQWRPGAYPHSFHSARRYRVGPYIRPLHYYTHVWAFGEFLPGTWFGPDYVIEDWWNYDLPAPPPGFDWVRVGDDALLVDEYTGRIVQVVRQLFW